MERIIARSTINMIRINQCFNTTPAPPKPPSRSTQKAKSNRGRQRDVDRERVDAHQARARSGRVGEVVRIIALAVSILKAPCLSVVVPVGRRSNFERRNKTPFPSHIQNKRHVTDAHFTDLTDEKAAREARPLVPSTSRRRSDMRDRWRARRAASGVASTAWERARDSTPAPPPIAAVRGTVPSRSP